MKHKSQLISAACIAALALGPLSAVAAKKKADAASPAPTASASPAAAAAKAPRPIPFRGTISSVDQRAKTFTIAGKTSTRVFKVTNKTEVMNGAATGKMSDIMANQEVTGSYWKNADGTLEAKKVKLGAMKSGAATTEPAPAEKKTKKSKAKASPSPTP